MTTPIRRSERKNRVKCIINGEHSTIPGGGMIIYDEEGVWLLKEKKGWNDYGGKNRGEDCDLATTIAREVCEEFYQSITVTRSHLIQISKDITPTILRYKGEVCYVCFIVDINYMRNAGVHLPSRETFFEFRRNAISNNPNFRYSTSDFKHIAYSELKKVKLNHRAAALLSQRFPEYF